MVKIEIQWNGNMEFSGGPEGHSVSMDAVPPIGRGTAMTPKHLLLVSLCGCTAMDVSALMKKHKQPIETFRVSAEGDLTDTHPKVFKEVLIRYLGTGAVDREKFVEAAKISMDKYCGISEMLAKAFPIRYEIELNGEVVFEARHH